MVEAAPKLANRPLAKNVQTEEPQQNEASAVEAPAGETAEDEAPAGEACRRSSEAETDG